MVLVTDENTLSVVFLGDANVGKTSIVARMLAQQVVASYTATVGVEMNRIELLENTSCGEPVALTLWDFPGGERFQTAGGRSLVHGDVCVLVYDATSEDSFEHITAWHDEYAQQGCRGIAPPCVILVGNKVDATDSVVVSTEMASGWCAQEHVDPSLWDRSAVGDADPTPLLIEVSARHETNIGKLIRAIESRGMLRKRLEKALTVSRPIDSAQALSATSLSPGGAAVGEEALTAKVLVRCVVVGDVQQGKTQLLRIPPPDEFSPIPALEAPTTFHDVETSGASIKAWCATTAQTHQAMLYCRGAHACIMTTRLSSRASLKKIQLWKESIMTEACIRSAESLAWIVIGCRNIDWVPSASQEAASFCHMNDCLFIDFPEEPTESFISKSWDHIAEYVQSLRVELITSRSESQLTHYVSKCPHGFAGCEWTGSRGDVPDHVQVCSYSMMKCRFENLGCRHEIRRKDRLEHEKNCPHRPAVCYYCEKPYATSLYEHLQVCEHRVEHETTVVPCPFRDYGCNAAQLMRGDVTKHLEGDIGRHVELLASAVHKNARAAIVQEQQHTIDLNALRQEHAATVAGLQAQLDAERRRAQAYEDAAKDMKLEMKLLWGEIEAMKRPNRIDADM